MARYTNLVEVSMELIDDGCDLLRKISGVHVEVPPAAFQSAR